MSVVTYLNGHKFNKKQAEKVDNLKNIFANKQDMLLHVFAFKTLEKGVVGVAVLTGRYDGFDESRRHDCIVFMSDGADYNGECRIKYDDEIGKYKLHALKMWHNFSLLANGVL